jgi:ankyrin repeat protein
MDEIYDAIREGDDERTRRLLAEWPALTREVDVLVSAARHGRVAIVGDLIAAGATVDICDEAGFTPIDAAARAGHIEIVRMLFEAEAGEGPPGVTPEAFVREAIARERFYEAIIGGDIEELRHLLREWPLLAQAEDALLLAAEEGQAEAVAVLLEAGAPTSPGGEPRDSPLAVAAGLGHLRIVRMILEAGGGDINDALLEAAYGSEVSTTRWLLDAGAAIDARDHNGRTALWKAASRRDAEAVVRLLLARGADVEARDYFLRLPPLFMAIRASDLGSVIALLEAGADPRATDDRTGLSALDYAAHYGLTEIQAALLEALEGPGGWTPSRHG